MPKRALQKSTFKEDEKHTAVQARQALRATVRKYRRFFEAIIGPEFDRELSLLIDRAIDLEDRLR